MTFQDFSKWLLARTNVVLDILKQFKIALAAPKAIVEEESRSSNTKTIQKRSSRTKKIKSRSSSFRTEGRSWRISTFHGFCLAKTPPDELQQKKLTTLSIPNRSPM